MKRFKDQSLKMEPYSSERLYHIHDWLIISLKYCCIVFRKLPTFLLSRDNLWLTYLTILTINMNNDLVICKVSKDSPDYLC